MRGKSVAQASQRTWLQAVQCELTPLKGSALKVLLHRMQVLKCLEAISEFLLSKIDTIGVNTNDHVAPPSTLSSPMAPFSTAIVNQLETQLEAFLSEIVHFESLLLNPLHSARMKALARYVHWGTRQGARVEWSRLTSSLVKLQKLQDIYLGSEHSL